jgi:tetratricopeptide (TPR) repeat protein
MAESAPAKLAAEIAPILQRAHAALAVMDSRRTPCALALAFTLQMAKRLPEADAVSAEVYKRHPRSLRALAVRLAVLNEAGRKAEALKLAEADAQARPNEPQAMRFVANAQLSLGRLTEAESTWMKLASSSRSTPQDHNMVAWLRLCRGDVGDSTLASIRRAADMSGRREPAILHTLASVLAERGEPEQAREALLESLSQRGRDELADDDRYVLGRIAEGLAFPAAARELYGTMKAPKSQEISSYMLAQRRLTRLAGGGAAQAAGGVAKPAAR